ncbi:MAG: restriction endonuclease subunit S [Fibrobacter sp.]|nr:restriction endonuclease subunit S [Fibrobacter sp.]
MMSVDKLREKHHINRVAPKEIGLLLSAQSYRPEITQAIQKIKTFKWEYLQNLVINLIGPGIHPEYGGQYPCLKTKNVDELIADLEPADYADIRKIKNVDKIQVKHGDLLINLTGAGSIGRVSVYYGVNLPITNQHIARMQIKEGCDEGYIASYLRSWWGERALEQGIAGSTGQINMVNEHVRSIPVILMNSSTQQYIGDKVRQAERLRSWAKKLRAKVDSEIDKLELPTKTQPAIVNRVNVNLLDERLDPRPYRTHYVGLVDGIKTIKNDQVFSITELASGCPVSSDDFLQNGEVPLIRIRNIGFDQFIDIDTGVTKEIHDNEKKYQAVEGMVVVGMDGIFRAQFFLHDELPMLVNQRVAMLTAKKIRAELLTHWLNRPEGQMQLNQWAVKTTVEHTSLSDIGRVRIPRLAEEIENTLADMLLNARKSYRYARFLTTAAKLLVEAIIEGRLDETTIVAAQEQLQSDTTTLDRAILSRLKTDGIDGKGQPLFSDLDELYRLLALAKEE